VRTAHGVVASQRREFKTPWSQRLQGGSQSKPLSLIIIKSYLNPPLWLDF